MTFFVRVVIEEGSHDDAIVCDRIDVREVGTEKTLTAALPPEDRSSELRRVRVADPKAD